ncbi:hypothetical protein [Adhaeribacter pallidiroseus]|uniref:Uncharacterized protein n=1 Tax=Adhaeribacter pallidiroseus TaxID=2072847 RepID=A0A369QLN4_9BACT|nr:hypothetical protein [Adhaeribacter pallidiroseus]RDC65831.1 hypothetical protein AHMF7616_04461 [Adhaeribacter pallidiroseus]
MATKDSGNSQGQTTPNAPQIDNIDAVTNVDENNRSLDDVNDVGGQIDKGQAHDDFNGGGDVLGRQGGGPGEKSGMGTTPSAEKGHQQHTISDKDTGHGTHRGGMGPGHSGQKGNHQGEDTQSPGQNTPGKNRKDELSTGSLDNQAGLKEEGEGGQQPRKR